MGTISTPVFLTHKLPADAITEADPNTLSDIDAEVDANMVALIGASRTYTDTVNGIEARLAILEVADSAKGLYTKNHGGLHCDISWKDADEIVIKCKHAAGLGAWIGAILNDGTYLELTTDYTIKYDTPANSGHIIDGITAKLNNEWFRVVPYEDSGGALAFGISWMPNTTFTNANPTNTLTTAQVNAQDIGLLFPVDAHIVCFQDTDEWETPLAWMNAGAITYDAAKDKPKISSRTSTVLTLGANLENNNFTAGTYIYQVDGFKPLQIDGSIASVIGARGYSDSGFRFRTDGAGNILKFHISGKNVIWANGSGAADYAYNQGLDYTVITNAYVNYLLTYHLVDKWPILYIYSAGGYAFFKNYFDTYGSSNEGGSNIETGIVPYSMCTHRILSMKESTDTAFATRGWVME